ncbi:MAG TPA: hypothetical protein VIF62_24805 [Labilithrix sp.]
MARGAFIAAIAAGIFAVACGGGDGEDVADSQDELEAGKIQVSRDASGALVLATGRPARMSSCHDARTCVDADGDGLVDAWEAIALDRLRPFVTFDEGEPLIGSKTDTFASIGRVAPTGDNHVLVNILLLYTRDYGAQNPVCFSASAHDGDVEHVALDLEIVGAGKAIVRRFFTTGHEGTSDDQSRIWSSADFHRLEFAHDGNGEPRWRVYSSRSKHATYATKSLCENAHMSSLLHQFCLDEDCAPDDVDHPERYTILPKIENGGEKNHPMADDLGALGFAGEHAWGAERFCGGLHPSSRKDCPPPVGDKLAANPFM